MEDYKNTLTLPNTVFPMRANLPVLEEALLAYWDKISLNDLIESISYKRSQTFILHDGPPYANGPVHMGASLNKILKDVVNKSRFMMGQGIHYVPGWDCHGLPIEWKVEQNFNKEGRKKHTLDPVELRLACRQFAKENIAIQKATFQRLGVIGRWNKPYLTMNFEMEAKIFEEIWRLTEKGYVYRDALPVFWSVAEQTALAEAEVEYADHKSPSIWVAFPLKETTVAHIPLDASFLIWTTTPWTIPANRALAISENLDYAVYRVTEVEEGSLVNPDNVFIFALTNLEQVKSDLHIKEGKLLATIPGKQWVGSIAKHPLWSKGYTFDVPIYPAPYVNETVGTGIVHTAPGHGLDDFTLGKRFHIPVAQVLTDDGKYLPDVKLFAGLSIFNEKWDIGAGAIAVLKALTETRTLVAKKSLRHQYPHSWRSKAPLVFRSIPQWFLDLTTLKEEALQVLNNIQWIPKKGEERLKAMLANRAVWCISRQRAWGVPIALFIHKKTRKILKDSEVAKKILDIFMIEGADAWYRYDSAYFIGKERALEYEKVMDVVDVWFESGSTHHVVLENTEGLRAPADLYLEGSDQHRGWFQSSLLESMASYNRIPSKAILTHGFVLDDKGYKMSKSIGNTVDPKEIYEKHGAEIIRLWAVTSRYVDDIRIGHIIIKHTMESYRKIRNVLRWLLGNLQDSASVKPIAYEDLPPLEQYILSQVYQLDRVVKQAYIQFDFNTVWHEIYDFCTQQLSVFYFDIRKDSLYCDPLDAPRRKGSMYVLDILFQYLVHALAPVLSFTAEEAFRTRYPSKQSIFLETFPDIPKEWNNPTIEHDYNTIRQARKLVNACLEHYRKQGVIGSSLEAAPIIYASQETIDLLQAHSFEDICITSQMVYKTIPAPSNAFTLSDVPNMGVIFQKAKGKKSVRSWKYAEDTGTDPKYPDLSLRDVEAVKAYLNAHQN